MTKIIPAIATTGIAVHFIYLEMDKLHCHREEKDWRFEAG
jgi:hypothetical protein